MMNTKKNQKIVSFRFQMLTLLKVLLPTTMIGYFSSLRSFHEKVICLHLLLLATGDKCDKWHVTRDGWHIVHDMWHVAFELLSVTCHIALLRFVNLILKKKECIVIINTMFIQHYVSCGMWHMSPVTFQMSHVTCHMSQKKGRKWWSWSVEGLLSTEPTPSSFTHRLRDLLFL